MLHLPTNATLYAIRFAYRSNKARLRVAVEMERLVESDTEEEEFEDVKKTNEEVRRGEN